MNPSCRKVGYGEKLAISNYGREIGIVVAIRRLSKRIGENRSY
jgi:hypothetical protein